MHEPTSLADGLDQALDTELDRTAFRRAVDRLGADPEEFDARMRQREREEDRREAVKAAEDACATRFPIRYREAVTEHVGVLAWAGEFIADPSNARSLLLLGPTGTGKTYQAYGAIRAATTLPIETRAGGFRPPRWQGMTYAELTASLRPRGSGYDTETVLDGYRKTELLFIDDLGAAKLTEFTEEATYRLINGRYEDMRPSIFTTNLSLPQLKDAVGDRIASRLAETCVRVVLEGPDRRRGDAAGKPNPPRAAAYVPDEQARRGSSETWWNN